MKKKMIIWLVVCAVGVVSLGASYYLQQQIAAGTLKVARAEKMVGQGKSLFSVNPVSKEVGKGLFGSADRKISAGKEDIAYYTKVARVLQVGGIILIVVGLGGIFVTRRNKR